MPKKTAAKSGVTASLKGTRPAGSRPRRLTVPKRIWYKPLTWRHRLPVPVRRPVPKARIILAHSLRLLWQNKVLFGGIVIIYGLLTMLLVRGFASGNSDTLELKAMLDSVLGGFGGKLTSSAVTFVGLLSSPAATAGATAGLYQTVLLVLCSLAFIWALRQVIAKRAIRVRDSFYQGMYPLVPFVLIFLLMGVQLLPMSIGGVLYSMLINYGIALRPVEQIAALLAFIALIIWSLRMLTASLFALYIVTLPNMTPLRAYRNARELVYGRRLFVWRKLIFLPVVLLLAALLVMVPVIMFASPAAVWVFFVLGLLALPVVHSYLYNLYRDLL